MVAPRKQALYQFVSCNNVAASMELAACAVSNNHIHVICKHVLVNLHVYITAPELIFYWNVLSQSQK